MTTKLAPEAYLAAALTGIEVLRTLNELDVEMNHKEFLTATGVIRKGDEWKAYHRKWSSNILTVMAAVERLDGGKETLPYDRIINARTGKAGSGIKKTSRITSTQNIPSAAQSKSP
jgi:hypothetical protein